MLAFVMTFGLAARVSAQPSSNDPAPPVSAPVESARDDNASVPPPDSPAQGVQAPAASASPAGQGYPAAPYYPEPAPPTAYAVSPRYSYGASTRKARVPGPSSREHDGLFLRFAGGFGAARTSYREGITGIRDVRDVETRGLTALLDFAIGGRIAPNLLLHGNVLLSSVGSSRRSVDGARDASYDVDSNFSIFGAGLTYYFMPANAYVSAMAGLAWINEQRDDQRVESSTGFGGALMVGKEWWVGPRGEWGVGAALRISLLGAPLELAGVESTMRGADVGIVFSATYN